MITFSIQRYPLTLLLLALLFFPFFNLTSAETVKVNSEIDANSTYENQPLNGTITITHDITSKVDEKTFLLDQTPLKVAFVKQVQIDPNNPLIISIYSFQIPGKQQGLYALPSVSVKVGSEKYQSPMTSYLIQAGSGSGNKASSSSPTTQNPSNTTSPSSQSNSATTPVLRLEANVEGPTSLYPGQHTKLSYFYYYSGDIELSLEKLPLLDAEGMIKIGEKEIVDTTQGSLSIREISQVVEGAKPGKYTFGPSIIEGYATQENSSGKSTRISSKLTSTAPAVTVDVLPFPTDKQPSSFNGAVGTYQIQASLKSPSNINVGDDITLEIEISGNGEIKNVPLPSIEKQPGFEGFFRLNDLPPEEQFDGKTKKFIVHMRPLSTEVTEIPSIAFSSFDPNSSTYLTVNTKTIPLVVKTAQESSKNTPQERLPPPQPQPQTTPKPPLAQPAPTPSSPKTATQSSETSPIEIEGAFKLDPSDLYNRLCGTWWALGLLPLGIALLFYQLQIRKFIDTKRNEIKVLTSQDILTEALHYPLGSPQYFEGLNRALKAALVEAGLLRSTDIANEKLSKQGLCGEVRALLCDIEEKRFAGRELAGRDVLDYESVGIMAKNLLQKIHESKSAGTRSKGSK